MRYSTGFARGYAYKLQIPYSSTMNSTSLGATNGPDPKDFKQ